MHGGQPCPFLLALTSLWVGCAVTQGHAEKDHPTGMAQQVAEPRPQAGCLGSQMNELPDALPGLGLPLKHLVFRGRPRLRELMPHGELVVLSACLRGKSLHGAPVPSHLTLPLTLWLQPGPWTRQGFSPKFRRMQGGARLVQTGALLTAPGLRPRGTIPQSCPGSVGPPVPPAHLILS